MATQKTPKPTSQPLDLQAQETIVTELRQQLTELESTIKRETRNAEIARDGFDRYSSTPGIGLLLQNLARQGVPPERQAAFNEWQRTRLAELVSHRRELESTLKSAREQWQPLHNEWRSANAEQLRDEAQRRAEALRQTITARQQDQHALRQRIAQINSIRVERIELQSAFDRAAGVALAAGQPMPSAPALPEQPVESVPAVEHAIGLIETEIDELHHQRQLADGEVQALRGLIAKRSAVELMELIENEAVQRKVSLADVRDELIRVAGPGLLQSMAEDAEHRYRRELESLRPEVEKLRADCETLRNGVAELTSRRFG